MTDRELLELAATAAGYVFVVHTGYDEDEGVHVTHTWIRDHGKLVEWNPLLDDGDALRLAIKLYFAIKLEGDCVYAIGCEAQNYQLFEWHKDDPYAATRRAIVRAAAEIGKELK